MQAGHYRKGGCGCVLAQLAPPDFSGERYYTLGADRVGIDPWGKQATRLGFFDDAATDVDYARLTEAWREVLSA